MPRPSVRRRPSRLLCAACLFSLVSCGDDAGAGASASSETATSGEATGAGATETTVFGPFFVEGAPEDFVPALFEMEEGEVRVLPTPDGAVVVRLDGVAPADPEGEAMTAERRTVAERVSQGIAEDIYLAYATTIQQSVEVRVQVLLEHLDADLVYSRRTTIASYGSPGFEHQLGSNPSRQTMDFDLSFGHHYLLVDPEDRSVE